MLGPLKFNLQATKIHMIIDSGHYGIYQLLQKNILGATIFTEFGTLIKTPLVCNIILYKWIDTWFLDSDRRMGV